MTKYSFFYHFHFGKCFCATIWLKNSIVTKAFISASFKGNNSVTYSGEQKLLIIQVEGNHSFESC